MTQRERQNVKTLSVSIIGVTASLLILFSLLFVKERGYVTMSAFDLIVCFSAMTTAVTNIIHLFTHPIR